MTRSPTQALAVGALLLGLQALPTPARALDCDEAWYKRNEVYKQAGYCFTTKRAIDAFGNAGCKYDNVGDVPLSVRQWETVAELKAFERKYRCAD